MQDTDYGWMGTGAVAVRAALMVDETNGYVLVSYDPWTVWQPGFWQELTLRPTTTITRQAFDALVPVVELPDSVKRGTYNTQTGVWTYPATS